MSKTQKKSLTSNELEKILKYQKLAKGFQFGVSRNESEYIRLENDLLKSRTFAAKHLLRVLTHKTVKRFLDDHNDYMHLLHELRHTSYVIKTNNPLKLIFDFIVNIFIVYSVLDTLYYLSFGRNDEDNLALETVAWVFFLMDFCLNFVTEYTDSKNYPIRNLFLIGKRYLRTWLVFDFLALLPLKLFGYREIEYFFRLSRIAKFNRIFFTFCTKNFTNYVKTNTPTMTARIQKLLLVIETFTDFCFEICKFMFFCYFFACVWFYLSIKVDEKYPYKDTFLKIYDIESKSKKEQVIVIFYFIFTTLTTVGYGDYSARNSEEMGLCILIMLIGSAWLALTMSKVMSFVKEFEKIGKPKDNLSELTVFIHNLEHIHGPMPSILKSKLFSHFNYFWKHNRLGSLLHPDWSISGERLTYIHDKTLRKLPIPIQSDILEYLFNDYFTVFFKFFGHGDRFRYDISLHMQPRYHNEEFVLFMEEKARELLLVSSGTIVVGFLKDDQEFVSCFNLKRGVIVGEASVFLDENSFADLKAERVQGMAIPENAVIEIMKLKYSERLQDYVKVVKTRTAALKKTLRESKNFEFKNGRSRILARLSCVYHKTVEKETPPSLREIYWNMKKFKNRYESIKKEVDLINSNYFD